MNTDINKQIEEEANLYASVASNVSDYNTLFHSFKKGYKSCLHSSRWRKVSEELPPINTRILVVDGFGCIRFGKLCELDSGKQYWIVEHSASYEVIEWKPID